MIRLTLPALYAPGVQESEAGERSDRGEASRGQGCHSDEVSVPGEIGNATRFPLQTEEKDGADKTTMGHSSPGPDTGLRFVAGGCPC
jgi:hypothetical protein